MPRRSRLAAPLGVFAALLFAIPVAGQETVAPESVGLSSERLARLTRVMNDYVDQGRLPGAVVLLMRRGQIAYLEAFGARDVESADPQETDDVFRIASQTKAIVSTAVLMLQEDGRLDINAPISRFLPEFARTTVAVSR
ncbi:MAG: beta-lactamase family protein, partial [Gemmatimonadetes bacterium]|nr:beta-lactamase family protein [Gemmatimonadota bacterium]